MKITVLWEDRRGVQTKGFGPHELLLACLVDDIGFDRSDLKERIRSHPRKGNGSLRKALIHELDFLVRWSQSSIATNSTICGLRHRRLPPALRAL